MVTEQDRQLFQFFAGVETANIVLSFITTSALIWVIILKSKELASYRYLLLAFAVNDIWFPLVHFLTLPVSRFRVSLAINGTQVICTYRDAFIMFSNGILTSKFSICFYAAAFAQTMPVIAHLFIYRLVVLKWPHLAPLYTGWNTAFLISITASLQFIVWFANCWFNYHSDEELDSYVKPFIDQDFSGEHPSLIGTLYYNEKGIRTSAVLATMGFNCIMLFWFLVIIICTVTIVNFFKSQSSNMASRTQQLQRQLFHTLLLQMIVPMLCVYLPVAGIINFPMIFRISVFPNFISAVVTFFPLVDAIITLTYVKIFREQIICFFRKFTSCNCALSSKSSKVSVATVKSGI